jgi:NitT/TauT family transport system permease protein
VTLTETPPVEAMPAARRHPLTVLTRAVPALVVVTVLAVLWEGYKAVGQALDDKVPLLHWGFPVGTNDVAMPHLWSIVGALFDKTQNGGAVAPLWRILFDGALFTLREAFVGFVAGAVVGVALAVVFQLVPLLGRALLPWIVVSQTIPFVATAPMVVIWGGRMGWDAWLSVSVIAGYLVFFPVVVNVRRGLATADAASLELMRSYAAGRWQTLFRLRFFVALPYLFAGLKLGAAGAVVGAIVGELPSGQGKGVGRLLLTFTSFFNLAPERLFAAVAAAALLGLGFVGCVGLVERLVLGPRAKELA